MSDAFSLPCEALLTDVHSICCIKGHVFGTRTCPTLMSNSADDPRLRAFAVVLEQLDAFEKESDAAARYKAAGEALHALREVLKIAGFHVAIEARFASELPNDAPGDDPQLAAKFQSAIARVWNDVMEPLTPRGVLLTHALLRLSEGEQPELLRRADPERGRHSSKPQGSDLFEIKRKMVLRACYEAARYGGEAGDRLARIRAGNWKDEGVDQCHQGPGWMAEIPESERILAAEAGKARRHDLPLTEEHLFIEWQALLHDDRQLRTAFVWFGGKKG